MTHLIILPNTTCYRSTNMVPYMILQLIMASHDHAAVWHTPMLWISFWCRRVARLGCAHRQPEMPQARFGMISGCLEQCSPSHYRDHWPEASRRTSCATPPTLWDVTSLHQNRTCA
jgi:hypothetical protein